MDASTVVVFTGAAGAALACQAVDPDHGALTDGESAGTAPAARRVSPATVMRAVVVMLTAYLLLSGLIDLLGGLGDASLRRNLGLSDDRNGLLAEGALVTGSCLLSLLLFLTGTSLVPGLRRLRQRAPVSWLALSLFLFSLAANLVPATAMAAVAATVQTPERATDLIAGGALFAVVGVAAVGPGVRRGAADTLRRLGLLPLSPAWWGAAVAIGVLLIPAADHLIPTLDRLSPSDCMVQQQQVLQSLSGETRTALEQIGIAVAAGVGEEMLFRGALQPRIGILLSTLLWASFHLQYTCHGLPAAPQLIIVALGFVFGALRRFGGLWAAIIAHAVYDATILLGASTTAQTVMVAAGGALAVGALVVLPARTTLWVRVVPRES
jgi:membrane protease YdiL (CAAX protease family)